MTAWTAISNSYDRGQTESQTEPWTLQLIDRSMYYYLYWTEVSTPHYFQIQGDQLAQYGLTEGQRTADYLLCKTGIMWYNF